MIPSQRVLEIRSAVLQSIRNCFYRRGFIEVETPVRIRNPALESFIDAEPSGGAYLRTSPELHMKRLLCNGISKCFQLGPCFRKDERGHLHNPEYTMLEWYRADADYMDVLIDTKAMMAALCADVAGGTSVEFAGRPVELMPVWDCVSVRDAFVAHAGWDPMKGFDQDRFDLDLVRKVELSFSKEHPTVFKDYPVEGAALAKVVQSGDCSYAERWELYAGGMELANAFSELTDAEEQRRRFEECAAERRAAGRAVYGLDEDFLEALSKGLPRCAGVALGVDRLVMLLSGCEHISEVRAFADDYLP